MTPDKWTTWNRLAPKTQREIDQHEQSMGRILCADSSAEAIAIAITRYQLRSHGTVGA